MSMKQNMKVGAIAILSLVAIQCAFKNDEGTKESPVVVKQQVETAAVEGGDLVSVEVVPLENVHEYAVKYTWTLPEQCKGKIVKHERNSETSSTMSLDEASGEKIDSNVLESRRYTYTLICTVNGADKGVKTIEVLIPRDLTLEGDLTLSDLKQMGVVKVENQRWFLRAPRILLMDTVRLKTDGLNFSIETSFLGANKGATIFTFSDDEKANAGLSGVSGGEITISAPKGAGELKLRLVGQNGGDGLQGKDHLPEERGLKGEKGSNATYVIGAWFKRRQEITWTSGGDDGKCHDTETGSDVVCPFSGFSMWCGEIAGNGGAGRIGLKGNVGSNGFNGGNTGRAIVKIESGDFKVAIEKHYGLGGTGGPGGSGGQGGPGGDAGDDDVQEEFKKHAGLIAEKYPIEKYPLMVDRDFRNVRDISRCPRNGQSGPVGPQGPVGDKGGPGLNGIEEQSQVYNSATGTMETR